MLEPLANTEDQPLSWSQLKHKASSVAEQRKPEPTVGGAMHRLYRGLLGLGLIGGILVGPGTVAPTRAQETRAIQVRLQLVCQGRPGVRATAEGRLDGREFSLSCSDTMRVERTVISAFGDPNQMPVQLTLMVSSIGDPNAKTCEFSQMGLPAHFTCRGFEAGVAGGFHAVAISDPEI